MNCYIQHYASQSGGGISHGARANRFANVYVGTPNQRGHGIGNFLAGLFRRVLPMINRGIKIVGKEAARAGMHVLHDFTEDKVPLRQSLRTHIGQSGRNLKRKAQEELGKFMSGSGYKRRKIDSISQSSMRRVRKGKKRVIRRRKTTRHRKTKPKRKTNSKVKSRRKRSRTIKRKLRDVRDIFGPA